MNLPRLKGIIREKKSSYEKCAKAIGKTTPTFSDKINGKNKFYIDELETLGNYLGLTDDEKTDIFLR